MSAPFAGISSVVPADIPDLLEMCIEHARYERAEYRDERQAECLSAALFGASPKLHAWIAREDHSAVGYATATFELSTWTGQPYLHMDCLFVRAPWRGRGIGRVLMQRVVQKAEQCGIERLQWQTPGWNSDAQNFYERSGARGVLKMRYELLVRDFK